MPFMKKGERERREKVAEACRKRNFKTRARKTGDVVHLESVVVGRRILKLANLASFMWCDVCDDAISLRFMEKENQFGLASHFNIRCHRCLKVIDVPTDDKVPDPSGEGRAIYSINCKAALG